MRKRRAAEAALAALARPQHGVVARRQALAVGLTPDWIDHRLRNGWLRRVHRGVYRVGPVDAPRSRLMAACLACGPSATVSHRSAAALWGMLTDRRRRPPAEVTVRATARTHPGIRVHRSRTLRDEEVTESEAVPVTTAARTLLDLAGTVSSRLLERALAEALALHLTTTEEVCDVALRHAGRAGTSRLRQLLDADQPALTRSEAEERFLSLIRRARLDPPTSNTKVHGYEVDFFWRAAGLVMEIDGFAYHSSRSAFEADRRRDAALAASGLRVVRVTWRQLVDEPEAVLVRVALALAAGDPVRGGLYAPKGRR